MGWTPQGDNNGPPIPVFDGNPVSDDYPDGHIDMYLEYWSYHAVTSEEKLAKRFSSSLRLEAASWYNDLATEVKNDRPTLARAFCRRFRPPDFKEKVTGLLYRARQLLGECIVTFSNRLKKYQELLEMHTPE